MGKPRKTLFKILKWLGITLGVIIALFLIVVLLIRTPWAQGKITDYATSYVSEKTGTEFNIERLFITFRGNVQLEGLYLESLNKDTLLYSRSLEAGVEILPLLSNQIHVSRIDWDGLQARVYRRRDSSFNFDFVIDSLASGTPDTVTVEKDTSSSAPPEIAIGPINFRNFKLHYLDSLAGIDAFAEIGQLELTTEQIDLKKMAFEADELVFRNSELRLNQFLNPPPSEPDTVSADLPFVGWENILLENITLYYESRPDSMVASALLGRLNISKSELELNEQLIQVADIEFTQSDINLTLPPPPVTGDTANARADSTNPSPYEWPEWKVSLGRLYLAENNFRMDQGNQRPKPNSFDASHLGIQQLQLDLQDVELGDEQASFDLQNLAFAERSGFRINQFKTNIRVSNQKLDMSSLDLITGNSRITSKAEITFDNIDSLLSNPSGNAGFELELKPQTSLSLKDAFYFNDSLGQDSLLKIWADYPVQIETSVKGKLADLTVNKLKVSGFQKSQLSLKGEINGLPDTAQLSFDIPSFQVRTLQSDLALLMDTSGLPLPARLSVNSSLKGNLKDLLAQLDLNSDLGQLEVEAHLQNLLGKPGYELQLAARELQAGKLTANKDLNPVSFDLDLDGSGSTLDDLTAQAKLSFQNLKFKGYDYSKLELNSSIAKKNAKINLSHIDQNLNFNLKLDALLDTLNTTANLDLDVQGADLRDLNLQDNRLKMAFNLKSSFRGNPSDFTTRLDLTNGIFISGETSYRLDSTHISLQNREKSTDLKVKSEIVEGQLSGNASLQNLVSSLESYLKEAMGRKDEIQSPKNDSLQVQGDFLIRQSPLLSDVLLPELKQMDSIRIKTAFRPAEEVLQLNVSAPEVNYQNYELRGLKLAVDASRVAQSASLSFERLSGKPIDMYQTDINFNLRGSSGAVNIKVAGAEGATVFHSFASIDKGAQFTRLSLNPDSLILNGNPWNIPAGNQISIEPEMVVFENFALNRNQQEFRIESNTERHELAANFNGFKLAALFSLLNSTESPVDGQLNGQLRLLNLDQTPAFATDLELREFTALGNDIGTLAIKAQNENNDQVNLNIGLNGPEIDLKTTGNLSALQSEPELDLNLKLNKLGLPLIEAFAPDALDSTKGNMSGEFSVSGPAENPSYEGTISFKQIGLTPTALGTYFQLDDEELNLNNEGVYFENFKLLDARKNPVVINGKIITSSFVNPEFDLQIESDQFRLLNSEKGDNPLYYGTAVVDLDLNVQGDLDLPVVDARVKLREETNVTYVVPASQAQIESRQGIVRFRNMKDSLDIFSQEEEEATGKITGYDVSATMELTPGTRFTVIIDPQSGDNLTVAGKADLNFSLSPNGNMSLSGNYDLQDGSYQLNLYELVKKKFNLRAGSNIVWTGDPMNAELDITAVYNTETSVSSLMEDAATRYQQSLPFEVLLFIEGTINEPRISFGLDMPEDSRTALGGDVYSRVQQLNENESQLNKQVFSLVVFDRFLPSGAVGSSEGGSSDLARSSVSKLLTGQLNQLANKYVKGVELNIDVDSYTDYRTGQSQQRTDLNVSLKKAFFDDRVVVEVGSNVGVEGQENNSQLIGNVAIEYLLNEKGTYRLRAYRKDEYQNLVEGQVIITGLGILFSKEFDSWEELWNKEEEPSDMEKDNSDSKGTREEQEKSDKKSSQ